MPAGLRGVRRHEQGRAHHGQGRRIERQLVELVNLRVSQINGCARCLDSHTRAALRSGETVQRLSILTAWHESGLFNPREQAALTLPESVTELPAVEAQDAAYGLASARVNRDEVAANIWIDITMNALQPDLDPEPSQVRPMPQS